MRVARNAGLLLVSIILASCGGADADGPSGDATRAGADESAVVEEQPVAGAQAAPAIEEAETAPLELAALPQAILVFAAGDVLVGPPGSEAPASIGMVLALGDTISVGPDSLAEVQLGELATILLDAETNVTLRELALAGDSQSARVGLQQGNILSRVAELGSRDRYAVHTRTAVGGVRGTEFLVSVAPDGQTTVAVSDGAVAVRETIPEFDEITSAPDEDPAARSALEAVLAEAVAVVEPGQQLSLRQTTGALSETVRQQVGDVAEALRRDPSAVAELASGIGATASQARPEAQAEPLAPENQVRLARLEQLSEPLLFRAPDGEGDATGEPAAPQRVRLVLTTVPADAQIRLADGRSARGQLAALFAPNDSVQVEVEAEGFVPRRFTVRLDGRGRELRVPLAPAVGPQEPTDSDGEPAGDARGSEAGRSDSGQDADARAEARQDEQPDTADARDAAVNTTEPVGPARRTVRFTVEPGGATLSISDVATLRGGGTVELEEGRSYRVSVSLDGFKPTSEVISVGPDGPDEYSFTLSPLEVLWSNDRSRLRVVRSLVPIGSNELVFAWADGTVARVGSDGRLLWTQATGNDPNENSIPVVAGNEVILSGGNTFVRLNASSGAEIERREVPADGSHLFGQRVVPIPGGYAYPRDQAIDLVLGGNVTSIPIGAGVTMSPAASGDAVYVVDNEGKLYIISVSRREAVSFVETDATQPLVHRPALSGELLYFAGRQGLFVAINVPELRVAWTQSLSGTVFTDPIATSTGVLVATGDPALAQYIIYGFSPAGAPLFPALSDAGTPPAERGGEFAYVTRDGVLQVRRLATGGLIGSFALDAPAAGARPILLADSILVALEDGRIQRINRAALQ